MSRPLAAYICLGLSSALVGAGEAALILPLWIGYLVAVDAL